ncbi:MAG: response regulator transcription factor [Desulfobacterales bacterium]|jgi:two-component system response regulator RegX3|nr:response regulator transcription factor [Desulfobacterales bacterium]MCK5484639.1 response regulator transcription factor [Desulfobacterales bacterium]NOQ19932.1 response regulator [Desulfobacterales bacterium]
MKAPKARILVVEDDAALLRGLLDVLVYNGYEVKGVEDGGRALDTGLKEVFDLILLDVMLPTLDGFSICKEIRKKKPTQGIIMITAKGSEDDIVTGFNAGADDYISKPFSLREVMVRVEAVLRRTGKNPGDIDIRFRDIFFDGKNLIAAYQDQIAELTRKEMDIIAYLHRHRDRIVSKKELLIEVWHYADADIETRTVDIHMLKLRKKIASLIGDMPFVNTIRGEGYRLEPEK